MMFDRRATIMQRQLFGEPSGLKPLCDPPAN